MSKFPDDAVAAGFSKRVVVGNQAGNTASLPTTRDGVTAGCVMIAASANAFVRFSITSSVTCSTSTDIFIAQNWPYIFKTAGYGYLAILSDVTGFCGITAVEIG